MKRQATGVYPHLSIYCVCDIFPGGQSLGGFFLLESTILIQSRMWFQLVQHKVGSHPPRSLRFSGRWEPVDLNSELPDFLPFFSFFLAVTLPCP
jgi:hypothetical protein